MQVPESVRAFHHSIYAQDALQATVNAYAEVVEVSLETTDEQTQATFAESGMVVDAFCNHALFLSIQSFRDREAT